MAAGSGFPCFIQKNAPFAITKSPKIRMTVFALVRHEEFDIKRLQRRLIESQRTFDIADSQNDVVEHRSPLQITSASRRQSCEDKCRSFVGLPHRGAMGPQSASSG